MQLFYQPHIGDSKAIVAFDKEESRHLVRVLRKTTGDHVFVTDGVGGLYEVEITYCGEKRSEGRIIKQTQQDQSEVRLQIGIAPTKLNDRFEWFLEKSTEIGIDKVSPIICARSERRVLKTPRMKRIISSASKQSLKLRFPLIEEPTSFGQFLEQANWPTGALLFIAHCGEGERRSLQKELQGGRSAIVLIGPEGDFDPDEIKLAVAHGFVPVSLGSSRLRTETAAIVACVQFNLANEAN